LGVKIILFKRLQAIYYKHRFSVSIASILLLFVFGSGGLVLVGGETLDPSDSHIVSLYADGKTYDIPSQSKTVGEFLTKSKVTLGASDLVEPSLDTKIEVDQFRIRVLRARPYVVRDGSKELSALSAHTAPRLIAESVGLSLKPADKVDFLPLTFDTNSAIGRVVGITRSKKINVSLYGSVQEVHTNVRTVGDLLNELQVSVGADEELTPSTTTELQDNITVYISRRGIRVANEEVVIQPEVEYVTDNDLTLGSTSVRDPGKTGKRLVTYQITTENSVEISRIEISSIIVEQPIKKIVARGRAAGQIGAERQELMAAAGIPADEYAAADFVIGHESGWCATKWQGQWGQCPSFYEEKYYYSETNRAILDKKLGFGLCQSTPAIKMASFGEDWTTNPVTQLKWCTDYARSRYGGWNGAYDAWVQRIATDGHGWW
jgi:uncharacterized protein YabE (DUF348 family)